MIFNSDYLTIKNTKKKKFSLKININNEKNIILWEKVLFKHFKIKKKTNKEFIINAEKIEKLSKLLKNNKINYHIVLKLLDDISKQIFSLKKNRYGIIQFDIDDIIIVDGENFLFINPNKIEKERSKKLYIDKIIKKNNFSSPEIINLVSIPNKIHYKTSIYSLAIICIYCLTKKNNGDPLKLIDYIYGTKLYWSIERCLDKNPMNRFLYII